MVVGGVVEDHTEIDAVDAGRDTDLGGQCARRRRDRAGVAVGVEPDGNSERALDAQGLDPAGVPSALDRDR